MGTAALFATAALAVAAGGREEPKPPDAPKAKPRLWARVTVSKPVVDWDVWSVDPLMFTFAVVNDGDRAVDPKIDASELLINGKPFKRPDGLEWRFIVRQGLRGVNRDSVPPGDYTCFARSMGDYFKEPGSYRVKWTSEAFEAPEVEFRVISLKPTGKGK